MAIILLSSSLLNYSYCLMCDNKFSPNEMMFPTSTCQHPQTPHQSMGTFPPLNVAIFCYPNFLGDKNPYIRRARIWEMVQEKLDSKQNLDGLAPFYAFTYPLSTYHFFLIFPRVQFDGNRISGVILETKMFSVHSVGFLWGQRNRLMKIYMHGIYFSGVLDVPGYFRQDSQSPTRDDYFLVGGFKVSTQIEKYACQKWVHLPQVSG